MRILPTFPLNATGFKWIRVGLIHGKLCFPNLANDTHTHTHTHTHKRKMWLSQISHPYLTQCLNIVQKLIKAYKTMKWKSKRESKDATVNGLYFCCRSDSSDRTRAGVPSATGEPHCHTRSRHLLYLRREPPGPLQGTCLGGGDTDD